MKRMLIMSEYIQGGGVEKIMFNVIKYFSQYYEIHILTNHSDKETNNIYPGIKYDFIHYDIDGINFLGKIYGKIKKQFFIFCYSKIYKFDIAIAFQEGPSMQLIARMNVPLKIAWVHSDFNNIHWSKGYFRRQTELECMSKFKYVVCVSELALRSVKKNIGDPGNLIKIYSPVDEEDILTKSEEEVADICKPEGKLLFITVGRLSGEKGYERLLKNCLKLNEEGFDYELWIIGEGSQGEVLKEYIDKHKLSNVHLLGKKENPYKYMKLADWFICSSVSESFGLVIQESIIMKLPVITTDNLGACEIFNSKMHGMVVENSEQGLYDGMHKALTNPPLSRIFKKRMLRDDTNYSIRESMRQIEQLF